MEPSIRTQWWATLLAYANNQTDLQLSNSPTDGPWMRSASGVPGVGYCFSVKQNESFVELRIDRASKEENKQIFDRLFVHKHDVDVFVGRPLDWERLDDLQHARIGAVVPGGYTDPERLWPLIHERMLETMTRLKEAIERHLERQN